MSHATLFHMPKHLQGEGTDLTDVIPEDGLVLRATNVPLEPGLWLAVIGDFQRRGPVTDLWEVRHCVSHCDGAINASISTGQKKIKKIKIKWCDKIRAVTRICSSDNTIGVTPNAYRVTLLTYFFSSTTTLREQARGANTWRGSGKRGSFSPGAAARMIALRLVWATPYCPACRSQTLK